MKISIKNNGFALPTILITSVVMLTVLFASVGSTSSISAALKSQYYNQSAQLAAEAGVAFVSSCLNSNNGIPTWTGSSPLKASTDCLGLTRPGLTCPEGSVDPACVVTVSADSKMASNFSIGTPSTRINGWRQLASSNNHTCGISFDNRVYCWGYNGNGQLGNGSIIDSSIPVLIDDSGVLTGKNIKSIAVGGSHTCAIAYDSQVYCWGANASGQLGNTSNTESRVPVLVTNSGVLLGKSVLSISAGLAHTCAIASDSLVYCWGSDSYGQLGNDAAIANQNFPVAVNMVNGTSALFGKTVRSIASGGYHNCVIASDSLVFCWGYNLAGQLGDNTIVNKGVPTAVNMTNGTSALFGKTVRKITANAIPEVTNIGYGHTCVIASDSLGYCWGYNAKGQIGDNSTTNRLVPTAVNTAGVLSGKLLTSIAASSQSTCSVASDGLVYCWGYNNSSQLGNGSVTDSLVAVLSTKAGSPGGTTALAVTSGGFNSCMIASDNQAYCWGLNSTGQLGDGSIVSKTSATAVKTIDIAGASAMKLSVIGTARLLNSSGGIWRRYTNTKNIDISTKNWSQLSAGLSHNCAIDSDSQAYCWGLNTNGQLGDNSIIQRNTPVAVNTANGTSALYGKTIKSIASGGSHSCAIASDDAVYCWGLNTNGQLGDSSTTQRLAPVAVNTAGALLNKKVLAITAGDNHTCALATDNLVYCWGLNTSGQLGDTTIVQKLVPTAVTTAGSSLLNKTVISISAGASHTCAVASDYTANCWGLNTNGQIGDTTSGTNRLIATAVNTAGSSLLNKTVISISAGASHTCAVSSDSLAHCWGLNGNGQLGDNSITQRLFPVLVNTTTNVSALNAKFITDISTGAAHSCAVATDGGMYCWGLNTSGQIGNKTVVQSLVPLNTYRAGFMNSTYASSASVKSNGSCVLSSSGLVYCWGRGTGGQIGNNDILDSNEPLLTIIPNRVSIGL